MSARLRQLLSNLGAIVLALLLGFVIWIAATLQDDPFITAEIADVPVAVVGQPADTVLNEPLTERVTVRVRGPQSVLSMLSTADLAAILDLSEAQVGAGSIVPVQVETENEGVRIESVSPAQQSVHLEAIGTMTLPVEIGLRGAAAKGYQLLDPVITPDEVTLRGPASSLEEVATLSGTLSIGGAREAVITEIEVVPRDAEGSPVVGVEWTPKKVEVRAEVRRRLGFKPDVTVIPDLRGDPAPGYRQGGITVEPSTVTLAGLPSVIEDLPAFVRTKPITITGATDDLTAHTTLTVPNTVVVVDVQMITVTLEVLPIESSRIVTAAIEIQGLQQGWAATLSPNFVQVVLVGPDTLLSAIEPGNVRVIANLFDYTPGVHRIAPVVLPPEGVAAVSVIPEMVEVVIALAPAPTSTPRPTATPN